MQERHTDRVIGYVDAGVREPEKEHGDISGVCGGKYLDSEVPKCEGSGVFYGINIVRADHFDVPVLVGVGLSAGKVISVGSYWRHKVGHGHTEIPRRGV